MEINKELIYLSALIHGIDFLEALPNVGKCIENRVLSMPSTFSINTYFKIIDKAGQLTLGKTNFALIEYLKVSKLRPLNSLLQNIKVEKWKEEWSLPCKLVILDRDNFPQKSKNSSVGSFNNSRKSTNSKNDSHANSDFKQLIEQLKIEAQNLSTHSIKACSETLLELLKKYTSNIIVTEQESDISLYDFVKMRAALSVCLYETRDIKNDNSFCLVGADFSGIQSYIYQIISKYAAKNLKGRSYFLRVLSDAVVRKILYKLDLWSSHVIYNSGGGFYLLIPNNEDYKRDIKKVVEDIEEQLFIHFKTALYVAIDSVELSESVLMHQSKESLPDIWKHLFEKRDKKKNAKFANKILASYADFFKPLDMGGDSIVDVITGEELDMADTAVLNTHSSIPQYISKSTEEQINLGAKLKEVDIVVVGHAAIDCLNDSKIMQLHPADLGVYYYYVSKEQLLKKSDELSKVEGIEIVTYNSGAQNIIYFKDSKASFTSSYYGGSEAEMNSHLTFEEMTENTQFERLGILRMDVDNLGSIFQSGIKESKANMCRYANLSRSFDYFFSGYLNTIWRSENNMNKSFIIYSGGDDVFIVGSWDITLQIAKQISEDFENYTCYNPAFSISGGIAVVKPKFPIMKGADMSAEEESRAKNHNCESCSKNSISFLSIAMHWKNEFPQISNLKDNIVHYCEGSNPIIPHSFIGKLLTHYQNAGIKDHKISNYKIYWMLVYDLGRYKQRLGDADARTLLETCIKEITNGYSNQLNNQGLITQYHPLELWALAARWAELEIRTNNN